MAGKGFSLVGFAEAARRHGLPTKFIERVQKEYAVTTSFTTDEDTTTPRLGWINFGQETVDSVRGLSFDSPAGEASGVQTIYHECTHAFLGWAKDQPVVAALIREGEGHYRHAPLVDKSKGDDDVRLFQEALAEYVGHRAAAFWIAGEDLFLAEKAMKQGKASGRKFWDHFRGIPRRYEQATGQRVFGYQNKGWPWSRAQVETTRAVSGRMKDFADRVILENAIPDQFARVKKFVMTYKSICQSVPGFICEF